MFHLRLCSLGCVAMLTFAGNPVFSQDNSVQEKPSRTEGIAESEAPQVTVLEPGEEPRTKLRYKFQPDAGYDMVMEMSMTMVMELAGQKQPKSKVPATRTTMSMQNTEITSEGNLIYEFELTKSEVLAGEGDNPLLVQQMQAQLGASKGISGSATITPRGITLDAKIDVPANVTPQLRSTMNSLRQSMNQMSAPLPEEAVGLGAVWKIEMPIQMPQMKLHQTAIYKLVKIDGDVVSFDVTLTQTAPPQQMKLPGVPANIQVKLESMESTGSGNMQLNLSEIVPTSDMKMETKNAVSAGGQRVKSEVEMEVKIHP